MSGRYAPVQSDYLDRQDRARNYKLHCEKLASDEHAIDDRVVPAKHLMLATARKNQIRKEKMIHEQELMNEILQFHYAREQKKQKQYQMSVKRTQKSATHPARSSLPQMKTKYRKPQKTAKSTKRSTKKGMSKSQKSTFNSYNTETIEDYEEEEPLAYSMQSRKPLISGTTYALFSKKDENDTTPFYSRNVINQIIEENGMKEIAQPPPVLRQNTLKHAALDTLSTKKGSMTYSQSMSMRSTANEPKSARRAPRRPYTSKPIEQRIKDENEVMEDLKRQQEEENERKQKREEERQRRIEMEKAWREEFQKRIRENQYMFAEESTPHPNQGLQQFRIDDDDLQNDNENNEETDNDLKRVRKEGSTEYLDFTQDDEDDSPIVNSISSDNEEESKERKYQILDDDIQETKEEKKQDKSSSDDELNEKIEETEENTQENEQKIEQNPDNQEENEAKEENEEEMKEKNIKERIEEEINEIQKHIEEKTNSEKPKEITPNQENNNENDENKENNQIEIKEEIKPVLKLGGDVQPVEPSPKTPDEDIRAPRPNSKQKQHHYFEDPPSEIDEFNTE